MRTTESSKSSGKIVGRNLVNGRFLRGHIKLGGRALGIKNKETKLIEKFYNIDNFAEHVDGEFLARYMVEKAINEGSPRLLIFICKMVDPLPRSRR